jgi:hypothetical protein
MHAFRDPRIADEVNRVCIGPCPRPAGVHDGCFSIVRDGDEPIVRSKDGGYYRLSFRTLADLGWVQAEPMKRRDRVKAGLADPPAHRRLTPAMVTVATALRANRIASVADLERVARERGLTIPSLLRQLVGRDADQALADIGL